MVVAVVMLPLPPSYIPNQPDHSQRRRAESRRSFDGGQSEPLKASVAQRGSCPARSRRACDQVRLFGRLALLETTAISRPVIASPHPTKRTSISTQYDCIRSDGHEVAQLGCPAVVARHSHPSVCVHIYLYQRVSGAGPHSSGFLRPQPEDHGAPPYTYIHRY